jgi:hypothetical protein
VNQNLWFIEQMSKIERKQIRADVNQIRLAKEAMKADHLAVSRAKVRETTSPLFRRVALTLGRAIMAMIG